jgi:hypothetical protein
MYYFGCKDFGVGFLVEGEKTEELSIRDIGKCRWKSSIYTSFAVSITAVR